MISSSGDFDGLVAVVTGGASGIGLGAAQMLSSRGARVVCLDVKRDDVPEPLTRVHCDVTRTESVAEAIAEVTARFGQLDVLVNNAGAGVQGTIEDNTEAEWLRVFDLNVVSMMRVSRAALPYLRRSTFPAVVNMCSISAGAGIRRRALYSATKGAVLALTRAMAMDYVSEHIRVNCVSPGSVDTALVRELLAQTADPVAERAAFEARQPLGRLVTVDEVAFAVAYLASPLSGATTGTCLAVDGGFSGLRP